MSTAAAPAVRLELPFPTKREYLDAVCLEEGRIDAQAREMFGFGYCHYLASALHEATGWRLAVMQQASVGCRNWRWCHAAVYAGHTQQVLDISGVAEPATVTSRYRTYGGPFRWVAMGWQQFAAEVQLRGARPSWWRHTRIGLAAGVVICSYVDQLAEQAREWDALS
jgi:hypothetical protein